MKRFVGLLLGCWALCTILSTGALMIGRTQPMPELVPELGACGDSLCYLGIRPSTSRWADSLSVLQRAEPLVMSNLSSDTALRRSPPLYEVRLFPVVVDNTQRLNFVNGIDLSFTDGSIDAGQVIEQFGAPCRVTPIAGSTPHLGEIALTYPAMSFYLSSRDWEVSPRSTLLVMSLSSNGANACDQAAQSTLMIHYTWRGFRNYPVLQP